MLIKRIIIVLTSFTLSACSIGSIKLWVANIMASGDDYQMTQDVAYGDDSAQLLDVYAPNNAIDKPRPVVVFFYGGCWGACTDYKKEDYRFVAQSLAVSDAVVVVADYRRYPDVLFPVIMEDATAVVSWVANHITAYGGDADHVFLMGHSSGAHMAAMLTVNKNYLTVSDYQRVKGFIGLAGPYDFLPFTQSYQRKLFAPESAYPLSQPINFVAGTEPPLLLMYGDKDDTVKPRNIENLTAKVKQKSGQVQTRYYAGVNHTGILAALSVPLRSSSNVHADIIGFINEQTQPKSR